MDIHKLYVCAEVSWVYYNNLMKKLHMWYLHVKKES